MDSKLRIYLKLAWQWALPKRIWRNSELKRLQNRIFYASTFAETQNPVKAILPAIREKKKGRAAWEADLEHEVPASSTKYRPRARSTGLLLIILSWTCWKNPFREDLRRKLQWDVTTLFSRLNQMERWGNSCHFGPCTATSSRNATLEVPVVRVPAANTTETRFESPQISVRRENVEWNGTRSKSQPFFAPYGSIGFYGDTRALPVFVLLSSPRHQARKRNE